MKPFNLSKTCSALVVSAASIFFTGCDNTDTTDAAAKPETQVDALTSANSIEKHAEMFAGCYTVTPDESPQIKVSQQGQGLVMQMKEPKSANRVWDDPESLEPIALDKVSKYFSIDAKNIEGMIGRPDRVLVLAQVKQAYVNIDPSLDSQYLGYILQGANTVFKVECDDIPGEELADTADQDSVSNITIKPAGKVQQ